MSAPDKYIELKSKHSVPDENFKPFYIDNIFTQEAIDELYAYIQKHKSYFIIKPWGIKSWHLPMPDIIISQATAALLKHIPNLEFCEASFGIYSTDWGLKSKLAPHCDHKYSGRPIVKRPLDEKGIKSHDDDYLEQGIVLDVQLKHDVDWPIFIEYEKFQLTDNQGLVFSNTQQIHWRDYMPAGKHLDKLFLYFFWSDHRYQIENQTEIMEERANFVRKNTKIWSHKELFNS
jgi:hypothetical protein